MKKSRDGYLRLTHRFIDEHARVLGPYATLVYISILSHAHGKKVSFPSERLIAEELGISKRSVIRAIKILERGGDIWIARAANKTLSYGRSNEYHLRDRGWYIVSDSHYVGDLASSPLVTGSHSNKNQINKKKNNAFPFRKEMENLAKQKRISL